MIYIVSNQPQLYNDFEDIGYSDVKSCIQYFKDKKYIGCDTETEGFSPYLKELLLVQLGDEENQFVIDKTVYIKLFKDFFEDNSKVFIFHFFYKIRNQRYIIIIQNGGFRIFV